MQFRFETALGENSVSFQVIIDLKCEFNAVFMKSH
jgi:hypothetical protein